MKSLLLLYSLLCMNFVDNHELLIKLDIRLIDICTKYKKNIMSKASCERQKEALKVFQEEMEDLIPQENVFNTSEIQQLKQLKKEAQSLEEYIALVSNCGDNIPDIQSVLLANKRLEGVFSSVTQNKYCVDIVSIKLGAYEAYLFENHSDKDYVINYQWKREGEDDFGRSRMGISKKSLRFIYSNRNTNGGKVGITIKDIKCQ